jgi:hypothetical protein
MSTNVNTAKPNNTPKPNTSNTPKPNTPNTSKNNSSKPNTSNTSKPNTSNTPKPNTPNTPKPNTPKTDNIIFSNTNTNNVDSSSPFQTAKEASGVYETVTDNYLLLLGITSALIIVIIIYFFSETYRVSRAIDRMLVYQGFQQLTSLDASKFGKSRLGDYYIESAYNAAHCGYQMYDYTSQHIVLSALQGGARYLEFNVFNSEYGENAFPVVSMGYKEGEWKMMVSDTPLETIFETIAKNAFTISDGKNGVTNPDDPIFIGLNLNTNSNLSCLNLIAYLITKYFGTLPNRLLENAYSYQHSDNIADMTITQSQGKVFIFASDGFQGSGLEEIVNYSWDNIDNNPNHKMQRLHYSTIMNSSFDSNKLIEYNRTGFTIIVPHEEGDFNNGNYDTQKAFDLGCQFIAMEFQYIDSNMDAYITRFKKKALIMKNEDLQYGNTNKKSKTKTTNPQTTQSQNANPQTTRKA